MVVTLCKEGTVESILSSRSNLGLLGLCPSYEPAISDLFLSRSSLLIILLISFPGIITSFVFLFLCEFEFLVDFELLFISLFLWLRLILRTTFFVISLAMRNRYPERLTVCVIRCESNFSCRPLDLLTYIDLSFLGFVRVVFLVALPVLLILFDLFDLIFGFLTTLRDREVTIPGFLTDL